MRNACLLLATLYLVGACRAAMLGGSCPRHDPLVFDANVLCDSLGGPFVQPVRVLQQTPRSLSSRRTAARAEQRRRPAAGRRPKHLLSAFVKPKMLLKPVAQGLLKPVVSAIAEALSSEAALFMVVGGATIVCTCA